MGEKVTGRKQSGLALSFNPSHIFMRAGDFQKCVAFGQARKAQDSKYYIPLEEKYLRKTSEEYFLNPQVTYLGKKLNKGKI